jgi:hypothetical protein
MKLNQLPLAWLGSSHKYPKIKFNKLFIEKQVKLAYPKRNKININVNEQKEGIERITQFLNDTDPKTKYLPNKIGLKDLDRGFFNYVEKGELKIEVVGYDNNQQKNVPTIYLSNEKWAEFSKTWQYVDKDKNLLTPFITVRRVGKAKGTHSGERFLIPQRKVFKYYDVPTLDNGEMIITRYKIPQPTTIDLTYEIKLFTKYQEDLNIFDERYFRAFASGQAYCNVNGHLLPILMESNEDASSLEDASGQRMYVSSYTLKLLGYIMDDRDFIITKTYRKFLTEITFLNRLENFVTKYNTVDGSTTFDYLFDFNLG